MSSFVLHAVGVDVILPRTREVYVAFETGAMLTASLATFLVIGRYYRRRLVSDALLVAALVMLAVTSWLTWSLPVTGHSDRWSEAAWDLAILRLLAGLMLIAAAWAPRRRVRSSRHVVTGITLAILAPPLTALLVGAAATADGWPAFGVVLAGSLEVHPAGVALEVAGSCAFAIAAVGVWRAYARSSDVFLLWLAAAIGVNALARLNNVLEPSLHAPNLHVGDAFRLLAFVLLLAGALHEIGSSWRRYAADALASERRRVARDLHDGVAQEVAFILGAARSLATTTTNAGQGVAVARIEEAAGRALDETRAAIAAVQRLPDEPLEDILAAFAEQLASRHGAHVVVSCDEGFAVSDTTLRALVRILREAVTNAMVHGRAPCVEVQLRGGRTNVLRIRDDGHGFDPASVDGGGFGLTSMRERAALIGGSVAIDSAPGQGTTVEVTW